MKNVILEKNSVSDVVIQQVSDLINEFRTLVKDNYKNFEKNTYSYHKENNNLCIAPYSYGNVEIHDRYGLNTIKLTVYNFNNFEDFAVLARNVSFFDSFLNETYLTVDIVCASINGDLYEPLVRRLLSHELRHFYNRNKKGSVNITKLYSIANYILNNGVYGEDNINHKIAFLIYWLDNEEIYANCQALCSDIKAKKLDTFDKVKEFSDLYNELLHIKQFYNDIFENIEQNKRDYNSKLFYNTDLEKLQKYFLRQIKYAEQKFGRVIAYSIENLNHINENFRIKDKFRKIIL